MTLEIQLIAPCGMNCGICHAFLREKRVCLGCRGPDKGKNTSCVKCIIKNCTIVNSNKSKFCYECEKYPCERLKHLDKRYRIKYKMSMLDNLEFIKVNGLRAFAVKEKERWRCAKCGGVVCVHKGYCLRCGPELPGGNNIDK
jgi:hypothetical protein